MILGPPLLLMALSQIGTATAADDALTSAVRAEAHPSLDLGRLLLDLPSAFIELAFVPLMPIALASERWHLPDRIFDLLTNDDKTLAVLPVIVPVNHSGLGLGIAIIHNDPLGSKDRTVVLGLVHTNRDRSAQASISRRIPNLSGRVISIGAKYGVDQDSRFYGFGGGGSKSEVRLIRKDTIDLSAGIDLLQADAGGFGARIAVAYRRRELTPGSGNDPPLGSDDVFALPPGFGRALDYPELTLQLGYDTRDSVSRTTTGVVASVEASATKDLNAGDTGGFRTTATVGTFIELLPLYRVLFLSVGAGAAVPIDSEDQIPLHQLIALGGSSTLRGYVPDRFIDRLGWWATAEYRYFFYEYAATGNGLSAALFTDVGRVGHVPKDLVKGPIAWSLGVGFRFEMNLLLLGRFQIAYGSDGFRISIGFGEVL